MTDDGRGSGREAQDAVRGDSPEAAVPGAATADAASPVAVVSRDGDGAAPRPNVSVIVGVAVVVAVLFLAIGFAVSWGLAVLFLIILIPGCISLAIIARHPERTGNRSMLGISDPKTLLEPFTGRRPHDGR